MAGLLIEARAAAARLVGQSALEAAVLEDLGAKLIRSAHLLRRLPMSWPLYSPSHQLGGPSVVRSAIVCPFGHRTVRVEIARS